MNRSGVVITKGESIPVPPGRYQTSEVVFFDLIRGAGELMYRVTAKPGRVVSLRPTVDGLWYRARPAGREPASIWPVA